VSMQHAVDTSEQRLVNVLQVGRYWGVRHPGRVTDGGEFAGAVVWSLHGH